MEADAPQQRLKRLVVVHPAVKRRAAAARAVRVVEPREEEVRIGRVVPGHDLV